MRAVLFAVGLLTLQAAPVAAQPVFDDPVALIEHVYEPYLSDESPEYPVELFSPTLRQLWDDMLARSEESETPILDFDPFINAQDYEITELVVTDPVIDGNQAIVPVAFLNFGEPQELRYLLVRGPDGWKIDDVESFDEIYTWRLSEILAADPLLN